MATHPNSRKITIYRSGSFLSVAQGKDVKDFFSASNQSVGSFFVKDSRRIASGLSFAEEDLLMPLILELDSSHPEFRKKVAEFYIDIDTKVPYDTGRTLEIGLVSSNTQPPTSGNLPIDLDDYLRYRHAIAHPYMAASREEAEGNPMKHFYIFDKMVVSQKASKAVEEKDAAMLIYQEIKEDATKVRQALTLLGVNPDKFEPVELVGVLRSKAETAPKKFLEVVKDKNFEVNFWIHSMVDARIIKNIGKKYFDAETDKLIGNTLEEAIYFFKDDSNSDLISTLKARLQDKQLK